MPPPPPGGGAPGWGGCEALLNGTLDVARRTTQLLNAHGKVPLFANPAYFARPPDRRIWLDEARLVDGVAGERNVYKRRAKEPLYTRPRSTHLSGAGCSLRDRRAEEPPAPGTPQLRPTCRPSSAASSRSSRARSTATT